jgi:hypothetical protein
MSKLLAVITALGLGVVGLVVWFTSAAPPDQPTLGEAYERPRPQLHAYSARRSVLLVTTDGSVVRLTAGQG